MYYFIDGSAEQYKYKNNFINLCYHLKDFGLEAKLNFFVTSKVANMLVMALVEL